MAPDPNLETELYPDQVYGTINFEKQVCYCHPVYIIQIMLLFIFLSEYFFPICLIKVTLLSTYKMFDKQISLKHISSDIWIYVSWYNLLGKVLL